MYRLRKVAAQRSSYFKTVLNFKSSLVKVPSRPHSQARPRPPCFSEWEERVID